MDLDNLLNTIIVCGTVVAVSSLVITAIRGFSSEHSAMYQIEKMLGIGRVPYGDKEHHYACVVEEVRRIMEAVGK